MRDRISRTALFGDMVSGDLVVGKESRKGMRRILERVRSGSFARLWIADRRRGYPELRRRLAGEPGRLVERVGRKLAGVAHAPRSAGKSP